MITYERYAEIRNSKGLKDSDICRMTGIPQSTFSEWKNGKYVPKQDKMARIAEALGMGYTEFVGPVGRFSAYNAAVPALKEVSASVSSAISNTVPALEGVGKAIAKFAEDPAFIELQRTVHELSKKMPSIDMKFVSEFMKLYQNATEDAQKSVMTLLKNSQKNEENKE